MKKRPLKPQSSTASSQEVAKPQASKSRRCTGKQRDPNSPAKPDGVASKSTRTDPWDPSGSIASVFGEEESGARLIEKIFSTYGDPKDYITVAWFAEDGSGRPNLVADPLNRPLQLSTVCDYKNRIFHSGLAEDCSGQDLLSSCDSCGGFDLVLLAVFSASFFSVKRCWLRAQCLGCFVVTCSYSYSVVAVVALN